MIADVGDDHAKIVWRTTLRISSSTRAMYASLDFDARAAGHFDVDDELSGIGAREVGAAEKRSQTRG